MSEPTFFDGVFKTIQIDEENSITLRVLTLGEQGELAKRLNAKNTTMTVPEAAAMMAEKVITAWDGPKFGDAPVNLANIKRLPMTLAGLISDAIQEMNIPLVPLPSTE